MHISYSFHIRNKLVSPKIPFVMSFPWHMMIYKNGVFTFIAVSYSWHDSVAWIAGASPRYFYLHINGKKNIRNPLDEPKCGNYLSLRTSYFEVFLFITWLATFFISISGFLFILFCLFTLSSVSLASVNQNTANCSTLQRIKEIKTLFAIYWGRE